MSTNIAQRSKRDKKIAKALGLCWHEWVYNRCVKCMKFCYMNVIPAHPNFSSASGMLLILQKGPEALGEKWKMFINKQVYAPNSKGDWNVEPIDYDGLIPIHLLQDPNKIANELEQFLEGR